jgi:hypothetical protein
LRMIIIVILIDLYIISMLEFIIYNFTSIVL